MELPGGDVDLLEATILRSKLLRQISESADCPWDAPLATDAEALQAYAWLNHVQPGTAAPSQAVRRLPGRTSFLFLDREGDFSRLCTLLQVCMHALHRMVTVLHGTTPCLSSKGSVSSDGPAQCAAPTLSPIQYVTCCCAACGGRADSAARVRAVRLHSHRYHLRRCCRRRTFSSTRRLKQRRAAPSRRCSRRSATPAASHSPRRRCGTTSTRCAV